MEDEVENDLLPQPERRISKIFRDIQDEHVKPMTHGKHWAEAADETRCGAVRCGSGEGGAPACAREAARYYLVLATTVLPAASLG